METDIEQIRAEVRFALNQLRVRNGEHEFETMTRTLARATVSRNLLPATGPVAAGGDQGRDFESYPTQLPGQVRPLGQKHGVPDKAMVGFACTLQQDDLRSKIRSDVDKIMGSGTPVDFVFAYCEADIPVARRHAIERDAHERHGVKLAVVDGNGITETLLDHATFWIAETYLHVPSRVLPPPADRPGWYEEDLARWHADREPIGTMGRLVDVIGCLHYASGHHEGRPDVPFWLDKLQTVLDADAPAMLYRRAQYEFVVANIRGLGSLTPADAVAVDYLQTALDAEDPSDLEDAALLLSYTSAAFARDETSLRAEQLREFNVGLQDQIVARLEATTSPGARCQLLDTLATLRLQPDAVAIDAGRGEVGADEPDEDEVGADEPKEASNRRGDDLASATYEERLAALDAGELTIAAIPLMDPRGAIDALRDLTHSLPDAPLFPVDTLSRLLTLYTPALIDEPGFDEIVIAIDHRVASDSGEVAAAESALDRAQALFDSARLVPGLNHLHKARLGLFNGDARPRMIEATLATATAYNNLGLHAAGKYFALAAAELCDRDDARQLVQGLAYAALADFRQGNWISGTFFVCRALIVHRLLDEQALDFEEHPWLSNVFFELAQIRSLATKLGTPYREFVDAKIESIGATEFLEELVSEALDGQPGWWEELDIPDHIAKVVEDLGRPPFADAAEHRHVRFRCLGVTWTVIFRNQYDEVATGERYAAALQIVLGHLARTDPVYLEAEVTTYITAADPGHEIDIEQLESEAGHYRFSILLPRVGGRSHHQFNDLARKTLAVLTTALIYPSVLSLDRFHELVTSSLEDGLLSNVLFGVPFDLAWKSFVSREEFSTWPDSEAPPAQPDVGPRLPHRELAMPSTPGEGYDKTRSLEHVQHRYDDLPPRMIPTLNALRHDEPFARTLAGLREDGWSDWQVLLAVHNLAKNSRLTLTMPATREEAKAMTKRFMAPEPPDSPMPPDLFTAEALRATMRQVVGSSAQSWWTLDPRQEPLDPDAILALLQTRYGWAIDDVDHEDPFIAPGRPRRTAHPRAEVDRRTSPIGDIARGQ